MRIKGENFKTTLTAIEKLWNSFDPVHNLQYSFFDQSLAEQYKAEESAKRIFTGFSLLAIFIACIGLFGLATYSTLQRTKEIGIRKVLGATTANIITILSKVFLKLVIISAIIAFPVAGWAMHRWLQDFAYHTPIRAWIFLLAGSMAAVISLLTICFNAIKAAVANPVKSLRTE